MNIVVYADIFDKYWFDGQYSEAIKVYYDVGRIFERSKWVAKYYEDRGQYDFAMAEYEFYIENCLQISDRFLPYPSGPLELYLLGEWLEYSQPLKAERYLKLYLKAEKFEKEMGEGIKFKVQAEEVLQRIQKRERENLSRG